jgi:hypothetical protein
MVMETEEGKTSVQKIRKISLLEHALPVELFERLVRAVRAVGAERMEDMRSYSTTFWVPVDGKPTNIVEECLPHLYAMAQPGPACIGMEWWLGRLKFGESLPFHIDEDRSLRKQTKQIAHPLWASILYLNHFPSSPTVVLDQVLSADGNSYEPPETDCGATLDAIPNNYVVFQGNLRHGVVGNVTGAATSEPAGSPEKPEESDELRLTLLVNYWDRRPVPPNCRDYDGTIYPSIQYEPESSAPVSSEKVSHVSAA